MLFDLLLLDKPAPRLLALLDDEAKPPLTLGFNDIIACCNSLLFEGGKRPKSTLPMFILSKTGFPEPVILAYHFAPPDGVVSG